MFFLCLFLSHARVRLIVDTDAGFDVDDVGAIGVANALMDAGEAEIIAIGHTNGFPIGIGGVSTLMRFYGRDDVPIGAYKGKWARDPNAGKGTADKYLSDLVNHYPGSVKNASQVASAVDVYRRALAQSPDHSVHIASIGITTNMRDLVQSPPDAHSPLSGFDLIAQKVNLVVWMDMMCVESYEVAGLRSSSCSQLQAPRRRQHTPRPQTRAPCTPSQRSPVYTALFRAGTTLAALKPQATTGSVRTRAATAPRRPR
jgi:hypothetical protein